MGSQQCGRAMWTKPRAARHARTSRTRQVRSLFAEPHLEGSDPRTSLGTGSQLQDREDLKAAQVLLQRLGHVDRAVRVLVVFQQRHNPAGGGQRAVQGGHSAGALGWLLMYVKIMFKHSGKLPVMTVYRSGRVVIKCPEPMAIQLDGDTAGEATRLTVQVEPRSLLIRVKAQD